MDTELNLALPASLRQWVAQEAVARGYPTSADYVREVLRGQQALGSIDDVLLASVRSGPSTPMTPADWEGIRAEVRERLEKRRAQ